MTLSDRTQTLILAGLPSLLALAIRAAVVARWHFDGLYGQDSYAYLQQARAIAHGSLPPDFFWPNGFPLLVAGFLTLFGDSPAAAQLAALLCGTLLPLVVFLLVRDLFDSPLFATRKLRAAFAAALIAAVAGQPLLSSVVVMADVPALLWATLAAWLTVRAVRPQNPPRIAAVLFFAAGAALGLAIITRWVYLLAAPALAGFTLYRITRRRLRTWPAAFAPAAAALIVLPQLALSRHRPDSLLHSWLLGWHPLNFFAREFQNVDGHFVYSLPNGLFAALPAGHPAYLFPVLGLAALWGG
ncbi:MAG: phospholipid carrier-dependent glycosyltransferase, partial [Chloroflexi bacterium]